MIWFSDDLDGLVVDSSTAKVLAFKNKEVLINLAQKNNLVIQDEEPVLHDLDYVQDWIISGAIDVDCQKALIAWNLFTDVVTTLNLEFKGNKKNRIRNKIYDKLFFGSNIPTVTPKGESLAPQWSKTELATMTDIMKEGIAITRSKLQEV